jgi:hypothetical protein
VKREAIGSSDQPKHLCTKKLIHKPNSGLDLGKKTEDPKSKRKEEKKNKS